MSNPENGFEEQYNQNLPSQKPQQSAQSTNASEVGVSLFWVPISWIAALSVIKGGGLSQNMANIT